jgi:hypothetical protein
MPGCRPSKSRKQCRKKCIQNLSSSEGIFGCTSCFGCCTGMGYQLGSRVRRRWRVSSVEMPTAKWRCVFWHHERLSVWSQPWRYEMMKTWNCRAILKMDFSESSKNSVPVHCKDTSDMISWSNQLLKWWMPVAQNNHGFMPIHSDAKLLDMTKRMYLWGCGVSIETIRVLLIVTVADGCVWIVLEVFILGTCFHLYKPCRERSTCNCFLHCRLILQCRI